MSHQEENQTLPHIQPMQHIPEPLPVLTHSVKQYIEWLTGNSSEQPTIRREHANFLITDNVILYPGMWSLES
jgi:hypothetical protein